MIFVLDETINADKPNVLLVIDSFDGRKWDDVLANDYNVDLETVRPKRDNKYQKLDIEYGGLDVYSGLIDANESGDDLDDALANLVRFRTMSVRRAARERLDAANDIINKSHETIERTNETISELRSRVKELRSRVAEHRRGIGREPTKASAAKILKTEAQIDATNEKLTRAKKRLASAQRRLSSAEDDAEIARAILARDVPMPQNKKSVPARVKPKPVALKSPAPTPVLNTDVASMEPKVEEMANDEVKPLFDKDPENLDDEIAFKPIDFGSDTELPTTDNAPEPLSFTAPVQEFSEPSENTQQPLLADETPELELQQIQQEPISTEPNVTEEIVVEEQEPIAAPVVAVRPVSPIVEASAPVEQKSQKSTFMYYVMLVLLILLSIGTLWLYQKSNSENIPDLARPVAEQNVVSNNSDVKNKDEQPFVVIPDIAKEKPVEKPANVIVPEPIAAPVAEPEPAVVEPEPVVVEPEPVVVEQEFVAVEPEPVVVKSEPDVAADESPFITPEPVVNKIATYEPEPVKIPSEAEVIASKPGYNVSQNEKMFVASPDYDTETIYVEDDVETQQSSPCENGAQPDSLGCCPGEDYTYTEDGFMCCNSVECFPPAD